MQYVKQPTETGFYWFKRPPYVQGFWWQKKTTITPDWEMCFVNHAGMQGGFAVVVGLRNVLHFNADVEWYGPIGEPEELYLLERDREDLHLIQRANLERARTD